VTTPSPRCRIDYEPDWRPDLATSMQDDQSRDAIQRGLEELAEVLAGLVDRPDEVKLVVPVSLADAVRRRENNAAYHTDRGGGRVAARTMKSAEGHIEVIIETDFLVEADANGPRWTPAGMPSLSRNGLKSMRRTIVHEAQHAVMEQRGSGYDQYEVGANAPNHPRWDYAVSVKMCDEHRAEWNAVQLTTVERPTGSDVLDVLCHLGAELNAANARHQKSALGPNDILQLMEDVYNACAALWTSMAYWATQLRDADQVGEMSPDITDLELWKRYVGSTWDSLGLALGRLPVADLTTPANVLQQAARGVAEWVAESLQYIGFRHIEGPLTGEAFHIERFDFPSQRG
jgi:hypothetical protein